LSAAPRAPGHRRPGLRWRSLASLVCGLAAPGCGSNTLWPASMEQQAIVRPLDAARPPPVGSIPLGGVETLVDRDDSEDAKAPFPLDPAAAARGREVFFVHCTPCHGPEGKGDGPVSAKFPPAPNLRYISICKRSDGYLYGTLTAGGRAMPPMREGTTSQERWQTVAFVRALQAEGCLSGSVPLPSSTPAGGTP
jgi:mono/diheme cytochrome c family protein